MIIELLIAGLTIYLCVERICDAYENSFAENNDEDDDN